MGMATLADHPAGYPGLAFTSSIIKNYIFFWIGQEYIKEWKIRAFVSYFLIYFIHGNQGRSDSFFFCLSMHEIRVFISLPFSFPGTDCPIMALINSHVQYGPKR